MSRVSVAVECGERLWWRRSWCRPLFRTWNNPSSAGFAVGPVMVWRYPR